MFNTTLGEVLRGSGGSIKTGPFGTALKAAEYSPTGAPVISVGEVGYGALRVHATTKRVGSDVTARLPGYLLKSGDIVFGRKGAVDRSAWVRETEEGYFLGSDGIRVRFGPEADSRFMAYQLQSRRVREWLIQHAVGTTMPSLNQPVLEAVPLVVPHLAVQREIAATLGALDDKAESNRRLSERIAEFAAAMATRLVDEVPTTEVDLSEVVEFNRRTVKPSSDDSMIRYLDIASVSPGRVDELKAIPWNEAPSRARRAVSDGDVVFSTVRPNRRSFALLIDPAADVVASTGFAVMTPRPNFGSSLLTTVAASIEFADYLESVAHGSAYPAVSIEAMGKFKLRLPTDQAVVAGFEKTTMPLRRRAWHAAQESGRLKELRDVLLPELLKGRVRTPEALEAIA